MKKIQWWQIALLVSLCVALLSPLASSSPDGLEKVAEDKGFIEEVREPVFEVIPDYVFPGLDNEKAATMLAGFVGTLVLFVGVYGVAYLLRSSRRA
jgi:hypothetical protein